MPQDAAAFEWLLRNGSPMAIVATKMDKLNRSEQAQSIRTLEKQYGALVIPASAPHGIGLPEIWKMIGQWTGADRLSV
jgi:GTP-binding protein EngB required for normal cell division